MIPGSFDYHRPKTVDEAVALLGQYGEEARAIAGGHSLIPMMKLRLAAPEHLIDLGKIEALRGISRDGDTIVIGATTTQAELIASPVIASNLPILIETAMLIADPQIRYVGTVGGNVANGDPGNDMPALMQCLGADYVLKGASGERSVAARDFYEAAYFTALEDGELLTSIRIPLPPAGCGWAYEKLKRKVGDYATAAAAVMLKLHGGACSFASIALTNVGDTPLLAAEAAEALVGSSLDKSAIDAAVAAAEAITNPASDGRGPAEYRTRMAGVMLRRAIARAKNRAA
ncbi:carbon monoxide dehydrogenase medium subunit [Breoghania corrubedonensis]|uniref:Carbon monoxide dehydrogenase medium subunit n=1 Tax=Breoghania corrubedonensis TaxID=665038 RepID=A0A2T5V1E4_9HYPH|nr:xanthine dehydrogenase family protein subunit M [Breoghania corrubedonensis]PTW57579.1 carbon monoxide dehydrogenase medium subunit [Breoghania corrubedonensis]